MLPLQISPSYLVISGQKLGFPYLERHSEIRLVGGEARLLVTPDPSRRSLLPHLVLWVMGVAEREGMEAVAVDGLVVVDLVRAAVAVSRVLGAVSVSMVGLTVAAAATWCGTVRGRRLLNLPQTRGRVQAEGGYLEVGLGWIRQGNCC